MFGFLHQYTFRHVCFLTFLVLLVIGGAVVLTWCEQHSAKIEQRYRVTLLQLGCKPVPLYHMKSVYGTQKEGPGMIWQCYGQLVTSNVALALTRESEAGGATPMADVLKSATR